MFVNTVLPDDLLELYGIFGNLLHAALDLVDHNRVKLYTPSNKNRKIVEIQAAHLTGITYKFFPHINYCPCKEFKEHVIGSGEAYTCKHVLAAKLSSISGKQTEEVIDDELFKFLIQTIGE